jgi:hypothetical protein
VKREEEFFVVWCGIQDGVIPFHTRGFFLMSGPTLSLKDYRLFILHRDNPHSLGDYVFVNTWKKVP